MQHLVVSVRSLLAGAAVLLASSSVAAQVRVALCGAAHDTNTACQWLDVQTRLLATNQFSAVDIINVTGSGVGTPPLSQLLSYDALLCWTNATPANNVTWGDVLANYVDAGGGVVVAVFANSINSTTLNIGGRWQTGYEVIMDQSGTTTGLSGLGTVLIPTHPVMAGVTAFQGGAIGGRPTGTALEVGAFPIAHWADGKILVAQGANPKRIDLGFYPPSVSCNLYGWMVGGDQLMTNALLFVARGARYRTYGSGCAGSAGVPTLAAAAGSRPMLGSSFLLELGNLPAGVAFVVMGFSDTSHSPFTLPLDLGQFGMPGCSMSAEALATQLVIGSGTTANWSLAIPSSNSYIGVLFYNQAFVVDPPANALGLTVSNAGKAHVDIW
jgi:hypothetical protein